VAGAGSDVQKDLQKRSKSRKHPRYDGGWESMDADCAVLLMLEGSRSLGFGQEKQSSFQSFKYRSIGQGPPKKYISARRNSKSTGIKSPAIVTVEAADCCCL